MLRGGQVRTKVDRRIQRALEGLRVLKVTIVMVSHEQLVLLSCLINGIGCG